MNLLLTGAFKYSKEQMDAIQSLGYDITYVQDERIPLDIDVTNIDAVICNGLFIYNDITQFKNLKFIQLTSAGMDRVPLDYINQQGIRIANARGVYSVPMAEWVVLKILEIYKKSRKFYQAQSEHKWEKQRDLIELTDKTAAIIGFGSVGHEIAKRLKGFDVNVIAVETRRLEPIEINLVSQVVSPIEIDQVLIKSDIVILTLPLTEQTYHLINKRKFEIMKKDSILINISRGGIVEEESLVTTLEEGKFWGVALDVFEEEPLPEVSLLWNFERTIITPHNSFVSDKVNERLFELIKVTLRSLLEI